MNTLKSGSNGMEPPSIVNNTKIVNGWLMYDWANSVYSLVISSAIFPIYYKGVTTIDGNDRVTFLGIDIQNSVLYSYALSLSFLIVAAMLPILSGIADYSGNKKSFMKFFVWLGSLSCLGLYFFKDASLIGWGLSCAIMASIGYSASLVFYDAYLPEIVSVDRYDTVSAKGYAMGYYGGVVLMVLCLVIIMNYTAFGFGTDPSGQLNATRLSFVLTGLWWLGFSIIPFNRLPTRTKSTGATQGLWLNGYNEIRKVWMQIKHQSDVKRFLWAFFFYNSGVQTVMYLAALFGTDVLHMKSDKLIATILIIQVVAAIGAWLFAKLSKAKGNVFVLILMNCLWVGVCVGAFLTQNENQFYALAVLVGAVMGGIQSLSRATYSKLIPKDTNDHTSYFSFYDVAFNVSIVMGTFSYGFVNQITGDMRNSALFLSVYFIAGALLLWGVRLERNQPHRH